MYSDAQYYAWSMFCGWIFIFCIFLFFFVYPLIYYTLIIPKIKKKLGVIKKNKYTSSRFFLIKPLCFVAEIAGVIFYKVVFYKFTGNPDYKAKKVYEEGGFWSQDYPVTLLSKFDIIMSFVVAITVIIFLIFGIAGFIFMKLSHAG